MSLNKQISWNCICLAYFPLPATSVPLLINSITSAWTHSEKSEIKNFAHIKLAWLPYVTQCIIINCQKCIKMCVISGTKCVWKPGIIVWVGKDRICRQNLSLKPNSKYLMSDHLEPQFLYMINWRALLT